MTQKTGVLLKVSNLSTYFYTDEGIVYALDDLSFNLNKGATLGIVGESGSGKSVTALSIMRLIQSPPGRIVSGQVELMGEDILEKNAQGNEGDQGMQNRHDFSGAHDQPEPCLYHWQPDHGVHLAA